MQKKVLQLTNKEDIAYLDFNPNASQTILLVHGNMSSGVHYKPLFEHLSADYRVLSPDLRGFGDSTYHQPIDSLEDFADDLADFLTLNHIEKVVFVGWSTGGGIGLKFAAKYPEKVSHLVLIESTSHKGYPIFEKDETGTPILTKVYTQKEAMAQDPIQVAPAVNALESNNVEFMEMVWKAAIYNVKVPDEKDLELYISETMKQRNLIDVDWALMTLNMSDKPNDVVPGDGSIHDVKVPVLNIWGRLDFVVPEIMYNENQTALPHAKQHIFDGGSHSPITDDPDKLSEIILDFIR